MNRIEESREALLIIIGAALALCTVMGWLVFRSIARPILALQTAVESLAKGDYSIEVPYAGSKDELGTLARAVEVLKQGAAAMEGQRWVKSHTAKLSGELQGAGTLKEFGQRLISGLVPVLGGGVAAFYVSDSDLGASVARSQATAWRKHREAHGLVRPWEKAWSASARPDRKPVTLTALPHGLLPHRLRLGGSLAGTGDRLAAALPQGAAGRV